MPDIDAIQRGLRFEQKVADAISGTLQPGSGNKFHSLSDVRGSGLIVSCKSEKNLTMGRIRSHLSEAIDLGQGSGLIPGLAFEDVDTGEECVLFRLSDFNRAMSEGIKIPDHSTSKGLEKRKQADIPIMLR